MRRVLRLIVAFGIAIAAVDSHAATLFPDAFAQTSPPGNAVMPPASPRAQSAPPANPATPPVRLPQRTEALRFDNWVVTCQEFADAPKKRTCNAELQAEVSGSPGIILVWTLYMNDSKQLVGVLHTPSGVMLAPGVEIKLDNGEDAEKPKDNAPAKKFVYESCEPNGCIATLNLDSAFVRDAMAASTTTVIIRAVNGRTVQFKIPIKGFDKAYGQLKANAS